MVETLRKEETLRGMTFEYCLITAGTSFNRAPSDQNWAQGDIMSIDSGGNYHGYIGDVCRMAIQGEPDAELEDLLAEIESIQRAGMGAMKPGAMGGDIYAAAAPLVKKSKHHNNMEFLAHGMGLVSHEAPRLTDTGPVPYPADDADKPLEAGMVVSVETTLKHPDARLHQAGGHRGGHARRPRGLRRRRARLEQGGRLRHSLCVPRMLRNTSVSEVLRC